MLTSTVTIRLPATKSGSPSNRMKTAPWSLLECEDRKKEVIFNIWTDQNLLARINWLMCLCIYLKDGGIERGKREKNRHLWSSGSFPKCASLGIGMRRNQEPGTECKLPWEWQELKDRSSCPGVGDEHVFISFYISILIVDSKPWELSEIKPQFIPHPVFCHSSLSALQQTPLCIFVHIYFHFSKI